MGRHSAPEDEDEGSDLLDLLVSDRPAAADPAAAGRHAAAPEQTPPAKGGTRADLRLMRSSPALLARCVAAVVVPFVLFTLVLLVIGKLNGYLLWIWIPAILAGVLFGAFLDAAHRRAARG